MMTWFACFQHVSRHTSRPTCIFCRPACSLSPGTRLLGMTLGLDLGRSPAWLVKKQRMWFDELERYKYHGLTPAVAGTTPRSPS